MAMFMAHGRNFVAAKTSERRDYVVMFMAHEQRNIAQITIHLPFTFRVCRVEVGRGCARGQGAEERKFNRFEFQHHMRWCMLDQTRLYFPVPK
jgi:hypothetical protein